MCETDEDREVSSDAELIFGSIEDETLNGKIRVSIVATSLDGQEPNVKPVISMVHRLQNRNVGYSDNSIANTVKTNQTAINATEGATALNMNVALEQEAATNSNEEIEKVNEESNEISLESATYLQNLESEQKNEVENNYSNDVDFSTNKNFPTEEETTPDLFSNDTNFSDSQNLEENKEPEMFENQDTEEDFEIPAFLRRQKN